MYFQQDYVYLSLAHKTYTYIVAHLADIGRKVPDIPVRIKGEKTLYCNARVIRVVLIRKCGPLTVNRERRLIEVPPICTYLYLLYVLYLSKSRRLSST